MKVKPVTVLLVDDEAQRLWKHLDRHGCGIHERAGMVIINTDKVPISVEIEHDSDSNLLRVHASFLG
jgi:hypothetical protein